MATMAENPIILNIESSYGALLIGVAFSCVMWGISCTQAFIYFNSSNNDGKWMKAMIIVLLLFDLSNQMLLLSSLWPVLIVQYGRIAGLFDVQPEILHHTWVTGVISVALQYYFLHRIYVYSGRRKVWFIYGAFMAFIAVWQVVESIPYDVLMYQDFTLATTAEPRMTAFTISMRACSTLIDVANTAAMCYLLTREEPMFRRTKRMIYRLTMLTIVSGVWLSIFSILVLALVAARPSDLWYCVFEFPLTSLYFSTLLANLNARLYIRGKQDVNFGSELGLSEGQSGQTLYLGPLSATQQLSMERSKPNGISIQVESSTAVRKDGRPGRSIQSDYGICKDSV